MYLQSTKLRHKDNETFQSFTCKVAATVGEAKSLIEEEIALGDYGNRQKYMKTFISISRAQYTSPSW